MSAASPARDALADEVLAHLLSTGRVDDSVRATARALGISHTLLLYHFPTREALVDGLRRACEQRERDHLAELTHLDAVPASVMTAMWNHLADPAMWPLYRVRFALDARRGPVDDDDLDRWLVTLAPLVRDAGVAPEMVADESALWVATCRGLIWQLVTGTPPAVVDRAAQRFFARYRS